MKWQEEAIKTLREKGEAGLEKEEASPPTEEKTEVSLEEDKRPEYKDYRKWSDIPEKEQKYYGI